MPLILCHGDIAIVALDEKCYERIGRRDPLVVNVAQLEQQFGRRISRIAITYVSDADQGEMVRLGREGRSQDAIKLAVSGWTDQPGDGTPMFNALAHREEN